MDSTGRHMLAVTLAVVAAVALIVTLKLPGLFIALLVAGAMWLFASARPDASEHAALRTSINLSADDIRDVIAEFDVFCNSQNTDAIADRTLHRPALLDLDCTDPTIEAFRYELNGAKRFLSRLDIRVYRTDIETDELESLLRVTDDRATELRETWLAARRAALSLGTHYKD
ncbi:hypothetical protein COM45_09845 [Corynebacterium accolens]|uniref:Uncharacterized protein n=1 Tax=Corynebacterium accolens TaxID=38284 RepID=A0A2A4AHS7_9CORY|nr:hypothetical protein COM45_09845 [Corynebacterium accolens]